MKFIKEMEMNKNYLINLKRLKKIIILIMIEISIMKMIILLKIKLWLMKFIKEKE